MPLNNIQKSNYVGRILVVDDDPEIREMLSHYLENDGFRASQAVNFQEMKEKLNQYFFDLVLLDVYLGQDNGFDCLRHIVRAAPFTKVIVMTARESVELAVQAMESGAVTFTSKSEGLESLVSSVKKHLVTPNHSPSQNILESHLGLLGQSKGIREIMDRIEQIKDVSTTVLVTGETGTGKELIARALHQLSIRSKERFEAVNCSAIPETLLEAELFGYKRGAFTDAKTDRAGLFQICSDGTLFLDEIGDMPLALQSKVLRALQEREIRPLGSDKTVKINTRIIAATHQSLKENIVKGLFREDLYYRLSILPIEVPPLRDRPSDIPLLIEHFLKSFCEQFNKSVKPPSHDLMARLLAYSWPGNVRELKNSVERGVILSKNGELQLGDIFPAEAFQSLSSSAHKDNHQSTLSYDLAKDEFEKNYLIRLLTASSGNVAKAARLSGKFRTDIYRLMEKHQIDRSNFDS